MGPRRTPAGRLRLLQRLLLLPHQGLRWRGVVAGIDGARRDLTDGLVDDLLVELPIVHHSEPPLAVHSPLGTRDPDQGLPSTARSGARQGGGLPALALGGGVLLLLLRHASRGPGALALLASPPPRGRHDGGGVGGAAAAAAASASAALAAGGGRPAGTSAAGGGRPARAAAQSRPGAHQGARGGAPTTAALRRRHVPANRGAEVEEAPQQGARLALQHRDALRVAAASL
mmetsp:Transcript_53270/g.165474  ORF Transcript_53270/g.165474 Transcript_53270/m.165474 type:complete len:230 (-) Transcript_53270:690-1379(-)